MPTNKGRKGANQHTKAKREGRTVVITEETREKLRKAGTGKTWSVEKRLRQSEIMLQVVKDNPDSYSASNVSGRVKTYEFNGMKFKGTWELKVAKILTKYNVKYTNKLDPVEYEWNGSKHLYFPDFYLSDYDLYIEVKGYKRERDLCKWKSLNNLIVFEKNDIENLENVIKSKILN